MELVAIVLLAFRDVLGCDWSQYVTVVKEMHLVRAYKYVSVNPIMVPLGFKCAQWDLQTFQSTIDDGLWDWNITWRCFEVREG